jgi:hypothetical protein
MTNCFIRNPGTTSVSFKHSLTDCYYLLDHDIGNPHFFGFGNSSLTFDGLVIQYTGTYGQNDSGDILMGGTNPASTIKNSILLPDSEGDGVGPFVSLLGAAGQYLNVNHNTVFGALARYGETYDGHAGIVNELRSNLVLTPPNVVNVGSYKGSRIGASNTVVDGFLTVDKNWRDANVPDYNNGRGYASGNTTAPDMWTAGDAIEAGIDPLDLQGDPQLVDDTRDIKSWGQSQEGTDGSVAAALAVLQADTSKIAELVTWVKAGFAPQNEDLKDAGHDSVTIGAVEYQAPSEGGGRGDIGIGIGIGL